MLTGKNQRLIFVIDSDQDKIKKPTNPFNCNCRKNAASGLCRSHGEIDFFAAIAALIATSDPFPASTKRCFGQIGKPVIGQNKTHRYSFKHNLDIILDAYGKTPV